MNNKKYRAGIWSAAPTPLTNNGQIDVESVKRLTEHHLRLGIEGVFLCGTSGEGPWLTDDMCDEVVTATVAAAGRRLQIIVQVTDNSAIRVLDNIYRLVDFGVDAVMMAPPYFQQNVDQAYLAKMFTEVLDNSPLPVGFYHRGPHSSVAVEAETVMKMMSHPNLIMVKDSSGNIDTMRKFVNHVATLKAPPLLLNGDEFDAVKYFKAGYNGAIFGGGCFNGYMSNLILNAIADKDFDQAQALQDKMAAMMTNIFGGAGFPCWLAAQKQLLVELGVFSTNNCIINYQLTPECGETIKAVVEQEKKLLLP